MTKGLDSRINATKLVAEYGAALLAQQGAEPDSVFIAQESRLVDLVEAGLQTEDEQ